MFRGTAASVLSRCSSVPLKLLNSKVRETAASNNSQRGICRRRDQHNYKHHRYRLKVNCFQLCLLSQGQAACYSNAVAAAEASAAVNVQTRTKGTYRDPPAAYYVQRTAYNVRNVQRIEQPCFCPPPSGMPAGPAEASVPSLNSTHAFNASLTILHLQSKSIQVVKLSYLHTREATNMQAAQSLQKGRSSHLK
jgi:hypothetical protein